MLKIKIELYKSSYRLRFTYPKGNRNTITVAPGTKAGFIKAQQIAQQIEFDILSNTFDSTHAKYASKPNEQSLLTIISLWCQYKELNKDITSVTTQLEPWQQTDRCLDKLPKQLTELDRANEAIAFLLSIYSAGTLKRVLANLKAACNLALSQRQISYNPYAYVKLPKQQAPLIECYSSADLSAILAEFSTTPSHARYVQFLAYTFCRPEEAIALTAKDICTTRKVIMFDKAYSRGILKATKNNKVRAFPINSQLMPLAEELSKLDAEYLFANKLGKRLDHRDWAKNVWKPTVSQLVEQGKVQKYLKPYCLRHSGITRCIRAGLDIATVARLAGTSTEMIMRNYLASLPIANLELPGVT